MNLLQREDKFFFFFKSVPQAPVWTDMGRGNNGQPTYSGARIPDSRGTRTWLDHQAMQASVGQWNPPPSVQSQWGLPPNQPGGWQLQANFYLLSFLFIFFRFHS